MTEPQGHASGTVTVLFSDIEGSTRLEVELGTTAYGGVRERHRALLREAFTKHGGEERGTEGDSFFVVFGSARDAVAAAVDGQRAIAGEPWPSVDPIRVRMGLHTGEVSLTGGDLIGYAINRAARIAASAHGGQVVLSGAARILVEDDLPADVSVRDLGSHRLKDLKAPERLSQLVIAGLPADFPALRSLDARPNNLPTQLTTFVGRERELSEALELLRHTRLLTLTGPGGTGKTRLSLQVAAAAVDDFPDGVWFVPIEPVREPALVAPTIARTLGVSDSATRPAIDGLVEALGDRRVLLVLDNFEQVIDAAPVTAELLRRCPNLTILVSSRAVLRVSGEQEYPVPGLPTPPDTSGLSEVERLNLPRAVVRPDAAALDGYESVRLFLARASAIRPGFRLTDANAPAIARIVAGLHGMPLAIELAAARVRLLTPEQIVARLEDRLALLTSGSRDLPERQQTLRGAIAWSYELLDPGARRLVDRLSVFIGGWELEAAEAVCGPAGELGVEVVDGLATLVDQSLVRAVETTDGEAIRYTTFDTIREFAAEMLALSGDEAVVRERHARAYLDLAERAAPELSGADQRQWLDRLERDHGNLRAALTWAVERPEPAVAARLVFALWRFWQQRGYLNEAWDRVVGIADHGWELPPVLAGHLAEAIGGIAYWRADYRPAADWYRRALDLWRAIGDEREIANALYNASYAVLIRFMEGNPLDGTQVEGRAMLNEALALYEKLGDEVGIGNIEWAIGSYTYFIEGISAEPWYRRSLERHRRTGQRTMEAWSLHMLALTVLRQNRTEEAREYAGHALRHFRDAGDIAGITLVLDDLSGVAVADGDLPRAGRLWGAARNLQRTTGTMLAAIAETGLGLMDFPTARDALSPDDLERYSAEGAALPLQELMDYAFEGAQGRTSLEVVPSPDAGRSV